MDIKQNHMCSAVGIEQPRRRETIRATESGRPQGRRFSGTIFKRARGLVMLGAAAVAFEFMFPVSGAIEC